MNQRGLVWYLINGKGLIPPISFVSKELGSLLSKNKSLFSSYSGAPLIKIICKCHQIWTILANIVLFGSIVMQDPIIIQYFKMMIRIIFRTTLKTMNVQYFVCIYLGCSFKEHLVGMKNIGRKSHFFFISILTHLHHQHIFNQTQDSLLDANFIW